MALTLAACTAADPTPANTPTEAPATTEAPAETEVPDGLDPETAALAAFFEKADENGEFFSDNGGICVPDDISGSRIVLRAEFAEIENPYPMFEGTLPTPSDTVIEVKENEPLKIDLDCDGVPESVALNVTPLDEEGFESRMDLTVRLGSDPDKAYNLNDNMIDSYRLYVIDCDTEDDRLDLLLIYGYYEDTVVRAIRVNEAGDGFDFFDAPAYFDFGSIKEGPLDISEGIPMLVGTDLFNTQELDARAIITSEGFRFIGSFSYRDLYDEYFPEPRTLKRELEVEKDGETLTLPAGTGFRPVETDNWTCVVLELEDGSLVTANIENRGYRYYINGLRQDEYCDIFYAG